MFRKIYYGLLLFFALAFGLFTCVGSFFEDLCGNTAIQEVAAPDRKHKAVIYTRNCGATTGYSTHISILPVREQLSNVSGIVLIADRISSSVTRANGEAPVEVEWQADGRLLISLPAEARIFTQEFSWDEVKIAYKIY